MSWPVITVVSTTQPFANVILMAGNPSDGIEDRKFPRRFYNFNMRLNITFPYQNTSMLQLTDNEGTDSYLLIDRLGNPVRAQQIQMYTQGFRCIACQYDAVTKTIRILSPICPTNFYIEQWVEHGDDMFIKDKNPNVEPSTKKADTVVKK